MSDFNFRIYDESDDGEFQTFCKLDYIVDGKVVETEEFVGNTEDGPGMTSVYYTGDSNHAVTQAMSRAWAWKEAEERREEADRLGVHPLELAWGGELDD